MKEYIEQYAASFKTALDTVPAEQVADIVGQYKKAIDEGKTIFVFGNGGSAMNVSHFATDMVKGATDALGKPVKVVSLNDNVGLITAIGNDYSYDDVFLRQLQVLARPGDLVMTLSVSGNSPNLVKAFEWAVDNGLQTIALVGGKTCRLAELAHTTLAVSSSHYGHVEDAHMMVCHMIAYSFMENA